VPNFYNDPTKEGRDTGQLQTEDGECQGEEEEEREEAAGRGQAKGKKGEAQGQAAHSGGNEDQLHKGELSIQVCTILVPSVPDHDGGRRK
jgi:hypothetical protein